MNGGTTVKERKQTPVTKTPTMPYAMTVLVAVLATTVLSACGSNSPAGAPASSSPPASAATTPTSAPPATQSLTSSTSPSTTSKSSTHNAGGRTVTVTPATGLKDQQIIHVSAEGFSPNQVLQVIECGDNGDATSPSDCSLTTMLPATSNAKGQVRIDLQVLRGPFSTNNIVCGSHQDCIVTVSQPKLPPDEEAHARIEFADG